MHILYPSNPLRPSQPDEQYATEVEVIKSAGFSSSLFSLEDFQGGVFRALPPLPSTSDILYRGWMLSANKYKMLDETVTKLGTKLAIGPGEYLSKHYLPNWYPQLADLTPETRIYPPECNLEQELRRLDWPEYFIKDFVKSLKTSVGSRLSKPEHAGLFANAMRCFRGEIEGGFCVRRVEDFIPNSEQRYFVVDGIPISASGAIPEIVYECAKRLSGRFYSVDIARRSDGLLRVIEVGDGQVSDLIGWTPGKFAKMLWDWLSK